MWCFHLFAHICTFLFAEFHALHLWPFWDSPSGHRARLLFKWGYCLFLMLAFILVPHSESLVCFHKKKQKACIKECLCVCTNLLRLQGHPCSIFSWLCGGFSSASKLSCAAHGPAVVGWLWGRWQGYHESPVSCRALTVTWWHCNLLHSEMPFYFSLPGHSALYSLGSKCVSGSPPPPHSSAVKSQGCSF